MLGRIAREGGTKMEFQELLASLTNPSRSMSVAETEQQVPNAVGLYSIHIAELASLPVELQVHQRKYAALEHVIYVGKALGEKGLYGRLVRQDLHHRGPSTFFRGIGSVLGYFPPADSLVGKRNLRNYKFSRDDTVRIREWMRKNLRVSFVELDKEKTEIESLEAELIRKLRPCLNTIANPCPSLFVAAKRRLCREIAVGKASRLQ
jgi:hypothetical protein